MQVNGQVVEQSLIYANTLYTYVMFIYEGTSQQELTMTASFLLMMFHETGCLSDRPVPHDG